jgi:hypothetical protein
MISYIDCLLVRIAIVARGNFVVSHFIRVLGCRHDAQEILELLLFQVALGQKLELSLAKVELSGTGHGELGTIPRQDDILTRQLTRLAIYLDAIVQVLFKLSHIQYLIIDWLRTVNNELDRALLCLGCLFIHGERDGQKSGRAAVRGCVWPGAGSIQAAGKQSHWPPNRLAARQQRTVG